MTFMTQPGAGRRFSIRSTGACGRAGRAGGRVAERAGFGAEGIEGGALPWTNWIAGIVAVYSTLFGIGKIIFGETCWRSQSLPLRGSRGHWQMGRQSRMDRSDALRTRTCWLYHLHSAILVNFESHWRLLNVDIDNT